MSEAIVYTFISTAVYYCRTPNNHRQVLEIDIITFGAMQSTGVFAVHPQTCYGYKLLGVV